MTSAVYDVVGSYDTPNGAALLHQPFHYLIIIIIIIIIIFIFIYLFFVASVLIIPRVKNIKLKTDWSGYSS